MANEKAQACNSILHRSIGCCIDRNTNRIKCNDEQKKIQLFLHTLCYLYVLYIVLCVQWAWRRHGCRHKRAPEMHKSVFVPIFSSLEYSHDADWRYLSVWMFFSLSPDFESGTPKNWLSRYGSSVIHWNICIYMFFSSMRQQRIKACARSLSLFPLASSEFNKPEFQLELHLKNERLDEWMNETHIWHGRLYSALLSTHSNQFN